MDKEYETPLWAQVVLWLFLVFGPSCAAAFAEAKPASCKADVYPKIMCEMSVFPAEIYWTTYINDVRADYDKGMTVYLTLPDDVWAKIEVKTENYTRSFYGRWHNHTVEFHK